MVKKNLMQVSVTHSKHTNTHEKAQTFLRGSYHKVGNKNRRKPSLPVSSVTTASLDGFGAGVSVDVWSPYIRKESRTPTSFANLPNYLCKQ